MTYMSPFDHENLREILYGENKEMRFNWMNAHVLRFLNIAIGKADFQLLIQLYQIWPEQMVAIYKYWGWSDKEIESQIARFTTAKYNTELIDKIMQEFG